MHLPDRAEDGAGDDDTKLRKQHNDNQAVHQLLQPALLRGRITDAASSALALSTNPPPRRSGCAYVVESMYLVWWPVYRTTPMIHSVFRKTEP